MFLILPKPNQQYRQELDRCFLFLDIPKVMCYTVEWLECCFDLKERCSFLYCYMDLLTELLNLFVIQLYFLSMDQKILLRFLLHYRKHVNQLLQHRYFPNIIKSIYCIARCIMNIILSIAPNCIASFIINIIVP